MNTRVKSTFLHTPTTFAVSYSSHVGEESREDLNCSQIVVELDQLYIIFYSFKSSSGAKMRSAFAAVCPILLKTVLAHGPRSSRQNDTRKSKKYELGPKRHTSKD